MMLCDDCLHAVICENTTQGNCDWYLSEKELKEKWIPVSKQLPVIYDSYLVMWRSLTEGYPDRLFYEICEYVPEENEWERIEQAGEAGAEIVAWMPLPERYEPKEKENG